MWIPVRINFDISSESDTQDGDVIGHGSMLYQGADFDFSFNVSIDDTAVDFSNRQWSIRIYAPSKKDPFFTGNNVLGDNQGNVSGSIAAIESSQWILNKDLSVSGSPIAKCSYDLISIDLQGGTDRVAEGVILIGLAGGA
jgi:hypothetical protein